MRGFVAVNARLLDYLICLDENVLWYYNTNFLGGLKVDENFEF